MSVAVRSLGDVPKEYRKRGEGLGLQDLSLHILDIVENALRANAKNIEIKLVQDEEKDELTLEIIDDGDGMSEQTSKHSLNPFFTTKKGKKVGLGLPFLAQSAEEAGGKLEIESTKGKGTKVIATFRLGHIDRKPLGGLDQTIRILESTHPEVSFSFEHRSIENG